MALRLPIIVLVTGAVLLQEYVPLMHAPKPLERLLRTVIPLHILYPNHFDAEGRRIKTARGQGHRKAQGNNNSATPMRNRERTSSLLDEDDDNDADDEQSDPGTLPTLKPGPGSSSGAKSKMSKVPRSQRVDLSGVWKRVKTENFEALLEAQGAGYVQRKLAAAAPLTHIITMDGDPAATASAGGCPGTVFRLQEKSGVLDTDYEYIVGEDAGPQVGWAL